MGRFLILFTLLMFCTVSASADSVWNMKSGSKITNVKINNAPTIVDYQPAYVDVREGGGGTTDLYKIAIYDSSGDPIANAFTEPETEHAVMGTQRLYFQSNSSDLTPGNTYLFGMLTSGFVVIGTATGGNATQMVSTGYPTLPASLAGATNESDGLVAFAVYNKYGSVLLSRGDLTETDTYSYEANEFKFNKVSAGVILTCETL